MLDYVCPNCNHHMRVPESRGGQRDQCEHCGHAITFPDPAGVNTAKAPGTAVPEGGPLPPAPAHRKEPRGRFSLNWAGLSVVQQVSVIGFVLTIVLIFICAGFAWPGSEARENQAAVVEDSALDMEE